MSHLEHPAVDRWAFVRRPWWRRAISFVLGFAVAVLMNYLLYRISLPLEPFVYVAF